MLPLPRFRDLAWSEVDPSRYPFDSGSAPDVVRGLEPASRVPVHPTDFPDHGARSDWIHGEAGPWIDAMTRALVRRYGPWALGWCWAWGENGGGGPVQSWCCPDHSVTTRDETLALVAEALCEWRSWLEDLTERFDRYPLDVPDAEDRLHAWERATVHLITHVVDRTDSTDAWYAHCELVLVWFLTRWGIGEETARAQVEQAIGGRFESWTEPKRVVVDDVAERLATSLEDVPRW
ncbi:hypothetical protein [Nocardiopsis sp. FIRDI 009]|uniref:hypothetical protein n=1 Tax=Nocardiopsis sp. FIRDI 009 TaxID=714197 RepID=UPI000E223324|nr:hypothetical protein [Nocardiopsis sp. FIRDI 009]